MCPTAGNTETRCHANTVSIATVKIFTLKDSSDVFAALSVKKNTPKTQLGILLQSENTCTAVPIATGLIHSSAVRAALEAPDWTRLGPYHAGRRGAGASSKSGFKPYV